MLLLHLRFDCLAAFGQITRIEFLNRVFVKGKCTCSILTKYCSNSDAVLIHCCFSATVVSTIQHVWCTAIPARSGSVMDVATHLAGV